MKSIVLSHLPLAKYASVEGCKKQLLAVFKTDVAPNRFLIRQALENRVKELRWICLYLPFILFGFCMLYFVQAALNTPDSGYIFLSISMVFLLIVIFKVTFYNEYSTICKRLMTAADELLTGVAGTTELLTGVVLTTDKEAGEKAHERHETRSAEGISVERVDRMTAIDQKELLGLMTQAPKKYGKIPVFLMDQSLRNKCGKPSIYDAHSPLDVGALAQLIRCVEKNIRAKMKYYEDLESIEFKTQEMKSTHLKYARILQDYYKNLNNADLLNTAKALRNTIHGCKVARKMHLL